jgi:HAD superfamily hydrolase (TIGR01509 family)
LTLDAIGLRDVFLTVITADDPVEPKPDPQIFLEAARRMVVEPAYCQVFEDGDSGLEAARRAGMASTDVRAFIQ